MYNAVLENIHVAPEGQEAFTFSKPLDWTLVPVTKETPRFDDPNYFQPLAVATAMYGVAAFNVGVRPFPAGMSLRHWVEDSCAAARLRAEDLREVSVGDHRGVMFDARHSIGAARVSLRNLYIEHGGNLYAVCTLASEPIFRSMEFILAEMTESFRPASPAAPAVANAATDPFLAALDELFPVQPAA